MTLNQPAPASNPFGLQQPKSVPLNQMSSSTSMGFIQPVGQTLMTAPLAPLSGSNPAVNAPAPPPMAMPPNAYYGQPPMGVGMGMGMPMQQPYQVPPASRSIG